MSVMVAKVDRFSELDEAQRTRLVGIYRQAFKGELAWMESEGRSTTSRLSVASAFSYIFDNKQLFLAVRVSQKYAAAAAQAVAGAEQRAAAAATAADAAASLSSSSTWIEDVTSKSMGGEKLSPFVAQRSRPAAGGGVAAPPAAAPAPATISMRVRDIAPADVLGLVTVEQAYSHTDAFVRCVAVSPQAQRLGVGKFLLSFVVSHFGKSAGLVLEYWEGHPAWLGKFYAKFGFVPAARSSRPHYRMVKRPKGAPGRPPPAK